MFQNIGFIVGPAIQAALSPIGEGKTKMPSTSGFHFDMYSACGYKLLLHYNEVEFKHTPQ